MLFYNFPLFAENPLYLFKVWDGGMSFHGGLMGVIIAMWWFARRTKRHFLQVADFVAPLIPFGLGMGRIGNFINGELWGRVTLDTPWAILFPTSYSEDVKLAAADPSLMPVLEQYGVLPRHPSQLYEMLLEGIVLFIILNVFVRKSRPMGSVSGLFLIGYGLFHCGIFPPAGCPAWFIRRDQHGADFVCADDYYWCTDDGMGIQMPG